MHKLNYTGLRPSNGPRRRAWCFALTAILLIGCGVAFYKRLQISEAWSDARATWRIAGQERECLEYTPPHGLDVCEEDQTLAAGLHHRFWEYQLFGPDHQWAGHKPAAWRQMFTTIEDHYLLHAVVFMHRRSSANGNRLVIVTILYDWKPDGTVTGRTLHGQVRLSHGFDSAGQIASLELPLLESPFRLYAGQIDGKDDSHFTIRYEAAGQPGMIDGWLQADDSVKLQVRDGPAKVTTTTGAADAHAPAL